MLTITKKKEYLDYIKDIAIKENNQPLIKWLNKNIGITKKWKLVINQCIQQGSFACLKTAYSYGARFNKCSCHRFLAKCDPDILKFMVEEVKYNFPLDFHYSISSKNGWLSLHKKTEENIKEIMQWINCQIYLNDHGMPFVENITTLVAHIGNLDILKYIHKAGVKFNNGALDYAISSENLDCIKYIFENLENPDQYFSYHYIFRTGNLDILNYFSNKFKSWSWEPSIVAQIIHAGNLACMKFAFDNGAEFPGSEHYFDLFAHGGVDNLKYLYEKFKIWPKSTIENAVSHGLLDALKYAQENGCKLFTECTLRHVTEKTTLDVIKFCYANGCDFDNMITAYAAEHGKLDILKYLHECGCGWSPLLTRTAARYNKIDCALYAVKNGCPWAEFTSSTAICNKNLEFLKMAIENKCPWQYNSLMYAISSDDIEIVKFVLAHGVPENCNPAKVALYVGNLKILRYLYKRGFICKDLTYKEIHDYNFLHENEYYFNDYNWNDYELGSSRRRILQCFKYIIQQGCKYEGRIMHHNFARDLPYLTRYIHGNGDDKTCTLCWAQEKEYDEVQRNKKRDLIEELDGFHWTQPNPYAKLAIFRKGGPAYLETLPLIQTRWTF